MGWKKSQVSYTIYMSFKQETEISTHTKDILCYV